MAEIRIISDRFIGRDTIIRACYEFSETGTPSLGALLYDYLA